MSDPKFIPGLIVKAPNERAPDYVKCKLSIKRVDLMEFLAGLSDEWINADVKVSQGGKWYAAIDDWKPGEKGAPRAPQTAKPMRQAPSADSFDDDIPFS
jgi:hypothetical protein